MDFDMTYDMQYGQPNWELLETTAIILTKPTYCSIYVFRVSKNKIILFFFVVLIFCKFTLENSKKKMSADVHPSNILLYFDNNLNYLKAKNLHSLFIAQSIQYIYSKTRVHSSDYKCHCFKCLVC